MILIQYESGSFRPLRKKCDSTPHRGIIRGLPHTEIRTRLRLRNTARRRIQPQTARLFGQRIQLWITPDDTDETVIPCTIRNVCEIQPDISTNFMCETMLRQRNLHLLLKHSDSRIHNDPAILPHDPRQIRLTPQTAMPVTGARGEQHKIPVAVTIIEQIPVSGTDHRIVAPEVAVGKDRIARASLKPRKQLSAARHTDAVRQLRAALCNQQIIIAVLFIQMRSLRPDRMLCGTFPDRHRLADQPHGIQIQLLHPDFPIAVIARAIRIRPRADIIAAPVIIKKETRIDPCRTLAQLIRI